MIDPTNNQRYAPGEAGYSAAIARASQANGVTFNARTGDVNADLAGGRVYAPYLISNGTIDDVLSGRGTRALSNFTASNEDRLDHYQTTGTDQFSVEDQINNGDADFQWRC